MDFTTRFFTLGISIALLSLPFQARGGTILEYTFADGNASNATNTGSIGASANGMITGGNIIPSPLSTDGQGLLLGGANGNGIRVPNVFDWGGEFTVSMLARLDDPQQNQQSILFDDFGRPGVLLGVTTGTGQLRFTVVTLDNGVENDVTLLSPDPFPIGEWREVTAIYDGIAAYLLLDGVVIDSMPASGPVLSNAGVTPHIGVESDGSVFPWKGAIDDFRISDVAIPIPEPSTWALLVLLCIFPVMHIRAIAIRQ